MHSCLVGEMSRSSVHGRPTRSLSKKTNPDLIKPSCPGHRSLLPVQQQFCGGFHCKSSFIPPSLLVLAFVQKLTFNTQVGTEDCEDRHGKCNGKLKPGTIYWFKVNSTHHIAIILVGRLLHVVRNSPSGGSTPTVSCHWLIPSVPPTFLRSRMSFPRFLPRSRQ